MGKIKVIYLNDEIHHKLSFEDNASALITHLLTSHYRAKELPKHDAEIKISEEIELAKARLKELEDSRMEMLEKVEQEHAKEIVKEQEEKEEYEKEKKRRFLTSRIRQEYSQLSNEEIRKTDWDDFLNLRMMQIRKEEEDAKN